MKWMGIRVIFVWYLYDFFRRDCSRKLPTGFLEVLRSERASSSLGCEKAIQAIQAGYRQPVIVWWCYCGGNVGQLWGGSCRGCLRRTAACSPATIDGGETSPDADNGPLLFPGGQQNVSPRYCAAAAEKQCGARIVSSADNGGRQGLNPAVRIVCIVCGPAASAPVYSQCGHCSALAWETRKRNNSYVKSYVIVCGNPTLFAVCTVKSRHFHCHVQFNRIAQQTHITLLLLSRVFALLIFLMTPHPIIQSLRK